MAWVARGGAFSKFRRPKLTSSAHCLWYDVSAFWSSASLPRRKASAALQGQVSCQKKLCMNELFQYVDQSTCPSTSYGHMMPVIAGRVVIRARKSLDFPSLSQNKFRKKKNPNLQIQRFDLRFLNAQPSSGKFLPANGTKHPRTATFLQAYHHGACFLFLMHGVIV